MASGQPDLSVCIPTYRGASHIAATIESVLKQSFTDFELIVVDDNSPDETPDIVARYNDSRIRLLRNSHNLGPQGNWNRALAEARGNYFKLLPQDDLLAPDCLAHQISALKSDEQRRIALVFGGRQIIDSNGNVLMRRAAFGPRARVIAGRDMILACVRAGTNLIGEPGNVLMRLELARRIGQFDATFGYMIDLDYWFRALRHGAASYLPQTTSSFRISAGSWSVAIGTGQHVAFRGFLGKCMADPEFPRIGVIDRWRASVMSLVNCRMRQLFYGGLFRMR